MKKTKNKVKNRVFTLGRFLVPILLVLFFVLYLANLMGSFDQVKNKAHTKILNDHKPSPESMAELASVVLGPKQAIPSYRMNEYFYYYNKVVEYMPFWAEAHHFLGFLFDEAGDAPRALASFQEAVRLNPHFLVSLYDAGVISFQDENFSQALKYLTRAASTTPDVNLAVITQSRFYKEVWLHFENPQQQILELMKDAYRDSFQLAVISHYRLGQYADALTLSQEALSRRLGGEAFFNYYSGLACFQLKDFDKAVYFLTQSLKTHPDHAGALYILGFCYKVLGKEALAAQMLQRAAVLRPTQKSDPYDGKDLRVRLL